MLPIAAHHLLYVPSAVHRQQRAESDAPSVSDDGMHYADDIMRHLRDLETRCGANPDYIAEHRGVLTAGMREVQTWRRGCCCCFRPQRTSHIRTCARARMFMCQNDVTIHVSEHVAR